MFGQFAVDAPFHRSGDETLALFGHDLRDLFAHGLAQDIGLAQGIAGQFLGDLHHLFLIEDYPVGFAQDGFQFGVEIVGFAASVFDLHVLIHHAGLDGTGPIKGQHRDEVVESGGLKPPQEVLHARRFQLEHGVGFSAPQELEGLGVVERDAVQIHLLPVVLPYQLHRPIQDGKGFEPQEIELDEADLFHGLHVELGDDFPLISLHQGQIFGKGPVGDDHPGSMGGGMPGEPFQGPGNGEELAHPFVFFGQFPETGFGSQGLFQTHVGAFGDEFGQGIDLLGFES